MSKQLIDSLKLIAPTSVVPRPSPLEFAVGTAGTGIQKTVFLQMATVHGPMIFILAPDAAKELAKQLEGAAGGIVVVPAGAIL